MQKPFPKGLTDGQPILFFSMAKESSTMLNKVQSVERALGLLELVDGAGSEGIGLSGLAEASGLKTPTAHNLLNTLLALDYVRRNQRSKRYHLGPRALALGRGRAALDQLVAMAREPLRRLQAAVDETIILAVYSGGRRHTVLSLESGRDLRVGAKVGADDQFYGTATGRMLLAQLDGEETAALIERLGPPPAPWAGNDFPAVLSRLAAAGLAELHKDHVEALAVPLRLSSSGIVAALGLYYPAVRGNPERRSRLAEALQRAAGEVQAACERKRT